MRKKTWILASLSALLMATSVDFASAETLREALAKAYSNSQSLNSARAQLRATDENVPQARAGLRPRVQGVVSTQGSRSRTTFGDNLPGQRSRTGAITSGIQINQTLFDGFQTPNNVNAAQAQVRASQKNLDNTVQDTLLDTVTVFMNVRRDREVAAFRRQSLAFLNEQVRAAQARFDVGEGTRTDVAQAQAQQALATALLNTALSQVASSEAQYLDVVGDPPGNLEAGTPPNRSAIPSSVGEAVRVSQEQHPAIQATKFAVDAASFQVKSAEGARLPTLAVTGQIDNTYALSDQDPDPGNLPGVVTQNEVSGTVGAQLTVPIYQGGLVASRVRQAKETLSQRRIEVDNIRDQVRSAVASAWAQRQAAEANVQGYRAQVAAAQLALNGVVEERNVGQRTTLDVLNAQSDVITAQILLAGAQRDTIVAAYTLASAVGSLLPDRLALAVDRYEPEEHYQAVQDKWYGLRTPDGR
ncbi:outer membrane protein [Aureimonas phyllosphaerae]|uniref:Outer membrane protein n=2 Tax=Aureimonas phyllosphaerae TaxID=1166078 RepID=A0A7W6FTH9_9HYPH|nr:TolC family outer membrane protein [Aureimonas phyllosphaerae]MBB3935058.1 outer membrane protein [Aureimonas phyllosphaerae]MBB3959066.1 outer membrane protein [Aureimonas phyllosphaerae]SFF08381.1 outer membrane protein [Aureimonas phyllosphaerae]